MVQVSDLFPNMHRDTCVALQPFSLTQWNEWSGCWLAGHLVEGRREEHARSRWLARCNGSRQPWPASQPASPCRCYLSASSLLVVDNDDYYTVVELPTGIPTRRGKAFSSCSSKSSWSNGPIQQLDAHLPSISTKPVKSYFIADGRNIFFRHEEIRDQIPNTVFLRADLAEEYNRRTLVFYSPSIRGETVELMGFGATQKAHLAIGLLTLSDIFQ